MKYAAIVENSYMTDNGWPEDGLHSVKYNELLEFNNEEAMLAFVESDLRSVHKVKYTLIRFEPVEIETFVRIKQL